MLNALKKNRLQKGRRFLYPAFALVTGVLVYLGFFHVAEPSVEVLLGSAEVYARSGLFDEAEETADRVLERRPGDVDARLVLAMVAEKRQQPQKALDIYRRLAAEISDADQVYRLRLSCADLHRRMGELEAAREEIRSLQAAGREEPALDRLRGFVELDAEDHDAALAAFQTFAQKDPESHDAKNMLVVAWLMKGEIKKARDLLSRVDEQSPSSWPLWPRLARTCLEAGDEEGALAALSRYAKLDVHAHNRLKKDSFWAERVEDEGYRALFN